MKYLSFLLYLGFFGIAVLGFGYFGPPQYTQFFTKNTIFRIQIVPLIDRLLAVGGSEESTVGYVTDVKNQVDYRPPSALAPIQVRGGERLPQGTIVSSGSRSGSVIRLIDDSIISLGENSTLQIELPEGAGKVATIELKVLEGTVMAEQSKTSLSKIRLKNNLGVVAEVKKERTLVTAKSNQAKILKGSSPSKDVEKVADLEAIERERIRAEEVRRREEEQARLREQQELAQRKLEEEKRAQELEEAARRQKLEEQRVAAEHERIRIEQEKARKLALKKAKVERKIAEAQSQGFQNVPGKTDISIGLYEKKRGNVEASQRYMAKALTNQGYSGEVFNDATRIAMDNVMESYIGQRDCVTSLDFIKNVARSYENDQRARRWAIRWHNRLKEARCIQ